MIYFYIFFYLKLSTQMYLNSIKIKNVENGTSELKKKIKLKDVAS